MKKIYFLSFCALLVIGTAACKKKTKPKQPGTTFSIQAFNGNVDSVDFTATSYSATIENGTMTLHAETATQTFELIFEASLQPGMYQLPGGSYTENGHLYELVDGQIAIQIYDTTQQIIGGQFLTETSDFSGSPSKFGEGEFVLHYVK